MSISKNETKLSLRVHPNASKNGIKDFTDEILGINVAAPPAKGKANKELIAYLSKLLGTPKSNINIIKGHTSRNKVVVIDDLNQEEVMKRLLPQATML
ncbi:MAG: DUF167 domain-containing protein [Dehalococcoidales bacterium]|nr:DUF167 domain-containing protein [Dehalococcoidales bacterium]